MPDASHPHERSPAGWSDAFAALPPETPPAGAWARVAARLDARTPAVAAATGSTRAPVHGGPRIGRVAGWIGLATAAALALVVAWPHRDAPGGLPPASDAAAAATDVAAIATAPARSAPAHSALATPAGKATTAAAIALPAAVEAARKPRLATRAGSVRSPASRAGDSRAGDSRAGETRLDDLYAESARLEALLALARDDRVSSAGAALLSADLDAQVAGNDAHLSQAGLDEAERTRLWQARVDALRQAAGFETTQRMLAAQGDGAALLVSVD
jgi:hypothetical protein